MKQLLKSLNACPPALDWVGDRTFEQAYAECPRGDWMLWLFARLHPEKKRELTLAKGHCANTVQHLMTDQRSIAAIDAAIAYGEGRISGEELADAARAADAAAWAADAAAWTARVDADAAARAANTATRTENQKLTADICRQYLPLELWNKKSWVT